MDIYYCKVVIYMWSNWRQVVMLEMHIVNSSELTKELRHKAYKLIVELE